MIDYDKEFEEKSDGDKFHYLMSTQAQRDGMIKNNVSKFVTKIFKLYITLQLEHLKLLEDNIKDLKERKQSVEKMKNKTIVVFEGEDE